MSGPLPLLTVDDGTVCIRMLISDQVDWDYVAAQFLAAFNDYWDERAAGDYSLAFDEVGGWGPVHWHCVPRSGFLRSEGVAG